MARGIRVQGTIVNKHVDSGKSTSYYFGVTYANLSLPKDFEVTSYAYAGYSVGLYYTGGVRTLKILGTLSYSELHRYLPTDI